MWRGDGIEVQTQQTLARIYSETGRFAEAFAATRVATRLQPNSPESQGSAGRGVGTVRAAVPWPQG